MKFKITLEVNEDELINYAGAITKISPLHKAAPDEADINWIHENKSMIIGMACEHVWDLYQTAFANDVILTRNKLYSLVKRELKVKAKAYRLTSDTVKYCFVSKSTYKST